jgi:hypothetical protein
MEKLSPFSFLNSISAGVNSADLMASARVSGGGSDPASPEKAYAAFIVNRGLSYFHDSVLLANEMNRYASELPPRMQYDFLRAVLRPRKRISKWLKAEPIADLELVQKTYGYSETKAREVLPLLTEDNLKYIRNLHNHKQRIG